MFRIVPLPIIRSLFTVHTAMVCVIQACCVYNKNTPDYWAEESFIPKINLRN